jgi:hypothetical protein
MKTVVGLYEDVSDAQAAINDLVRSGFDRGNISLVTTNRWADETAIAGDVTATNGDTITGTDQLGSDVAAGVLTGGAVGGLAGVLLGLGALAIPGLGPIIAAGPLVAGLTGAGVGAAVGGLVGALVNWGVPQDEAEMYAESVRRGGVLVGLKTDEANTERAAEIMNRYDPIDIERRSDYWRETGWTGYDASSSAWTADQIDADELSYSDYLDYSTYAPAFREHFETTYPNSERDYTWYDPAYRYGYRLGNDDRYRVYNTWDEIEAEARSGWAKTEFAAERAWDNVKDAVRQGWEQVKDAFDFDSDYTEFEPGFREHYQTRFGAGGREFDWYGPGYRYGYDMAMDERWDEYNTWDEVEAEARAGWEKTEHAAERAWDDLKDAVRQGWEEVRDALDLEADYAEREPGFMEHFDTQYRNQNLHDYDWYEPAYRFGYITGLDERYDDNGAWDDTVEADIRREWEASDYAGESAWEEIKDAVRRGWESVRETFDMDDFDEDETFEPGVGGYTSHR